MISNESPFPRGSRYHAGAAPRPPVVEDTLKAESLHIERKSFQFTLKENPRGRFLRITEDVNGHRDSIIIPATGLGEFRKALDGMIEAAGSAPAKRG